MRTPGIILWALLSATTTQAQTPDLKALDAYLEKARQEWEVPGLAVAIVRNDSVVFAKGYGVLELGRPERVDVHTLFAIGSATKPFTTAALAMLAEEKRLTWDDRVTTHLPSFQLFDAYRTREMLVRDLVSHRVGLARSDLLWGGSPFDRDDIVRRVRYIAPTVSFRTQYGYNNNMFIAAGQIIPALTSKSWDDFVAERIFTPLGMTRTTTTTDHLPATPNVAKPHVRRKGTVQPIMWRDIDNAGPAGSIYSSVSDMMHWLRFQLGHGTYQGRKLVSRESIRELHTPQTVIRVEDWMQTPGPIPALMVPGTHFMAYGLGWFLQDYRGRKYINHGGSIDGMRAQSGIMPEENLGLVVLSSLGGTVFPEALTFRILDTFLGGPQRDWSAEALAKFREHERRGLNARRIAEERRARGTRHSLALTEYAGTYSHDAYGDVKITQAGELLHVDWRTGRNGPLEHWHYDTFRLAVGDDNLFITFNLDASAKVRSLSLAGLEFTRQQERGAPRREETLGRAPDRVH